MRQKWTVEDLRSHLPPGWAIVPIEPTNEMHKACKAAIYRYMSDLPADERAKLKKMMKGHPHGWILDYRTKQRLRWKAMVEAAQADGQVTHETQK